MLHVDLVPQKPTQSGESLVELGSFRRLIGHELKFAAEASVVDGQPLSEVGLLIVVDPFQGDVSVLVEVSVAGLVGLDVEGSGVSGFGVLDLES